MAKTIGFAHASDEHLGSAGIEIEARCWLVDYIECQKEVSHVWMSLTKFTRASVDLLIHGPCVGP